MKSIIVLKFDNMYGGIENYLMSMQVQLEQQIRFIFLSESEHNMHEKQVLSHNGAMIRVPREYGLLSYLSNMRNKLKLLRKETDTIYLNIGDYSHEKLAVLILAKRLKYHIIVHSHGAKSELSNSNFIHKSTHQIIRLCSLYCLRNCTKLAVSDRAGTFLYGKQSFHILAPGIETKRFLYNDTVRKELRKELECQNKFVVGFVGRMVEVKNPSFAIRVISELCHVLGKENVLLMMIGDGPLLDDMKRLTEAENIKRQVLFVGATNRVNQYLQAMDCMIGTSFSEGMGINLLEAQAAGLPCVCAQGRYPDEIAVTKLVHMIPLESGEQKWAEMLHQIWYQKDKIEIKRFEEIDPALVQYDTANLSIKLYRYLTGMMEDTKTA